ncbi:hypothetical protein [Salinivibrio kushneri]|uniref:hypothetical protein n=1 Tax=Salinivibrio kushneri TaxID=1908198 RepID=UPI0009857EB8|nr:hypothetical protein [Salinivibrio kushneri]OOE57688.1 hypothetical protein BZG18_15610 [Salinivibrio kushneri]
MKKYIAMIVVFTAIPFVLWSAWFAEFGISSSTSDWSNFGGFIGGTLSPLLAFSSFIGLLITIKDQRKKNELEINIRNSSVYCTHAIQCLDRAYNVLSNNGKEAQPVQDRLVWLTTARLLLSADKLYSQIVNEAESEKALYRSEVEYYQIKFYNLLDITGMRSFSMSKDYFSQASSIPGDEIEERSIKVIYDFVDWSESHIDPINGVEYFEEHDLKKFHGSQHGLKQFLQEKINRRKGI